MILQENLATDPSVATTEVGWTENEAIPAPKQTRGQIRLGMYAEVVFRIKRFYIMSKSN